MKKIKAWLNDYRFIKYYRFLTKIKFYLTFLKLLFSGEYNVQKFDKDSVKKYLVDKKNLEPKSKQCVCIPEYVGISSQEVKQYETEEIYCGIVRNSGVIGATSCIFKEGKCLHEIFEKQEERVEVSYGPVIFDYRDSVVVKYSKAVDRITRGIDLVGNAPGNYYHATIELLGKITYLQALEEYEDWPLLVDEAVLQIPQLKQLLDRLNDTGREVIRIKDGHYYEVEELLYISRTSWMPIDLKDRQLTKESDFRISPMYIKNIRSKVLCGSEGERKKDIFVSRRNTANARLVNEDAVKNFFATKGFEIVYPEEMTFEEQVACFKQADCVVATTGAAMTNILYCPKGTIIGCIIPQEFHFYMYSTIAYQLGLIPLFMSADIVKKTLWPSMDEFELKMKWCEQFVKEVAEVKEDNENCKRY